MSKILLIENEQETITQCRGSLEALGYPLEVAQTASDGLSMAKATAPLGILLNLATPGANGLEICKTIHSDEALKNVPIILLTLKEGKFDHIYTKLYGIVAFLKKPFTSDDLTQIVAQHCPVPESAEMGAEEAEEIPTLIIEAPESEDLSQVTQTMNFDAMAGAEEPSQAESDAYTIDETELGGEAGEATPSLDFNMPGEAKEPEGASADTLFAVGAEQTEAASGSDFSSFNFGAEPAAAGEPQAGTEAEGFNFSSDGGADFGGSAFGQQEHHEEGFAAESFAAGAEAPSFETEPTQHTQEPAAPEDDVFSSTQKFGGGFEMPSESASVGEAPAEGEAKDEGFSSFSEDMGSEFSSTMGESSTENITEPTGGANMQTGKKPGGKKILLLVGVLVVVLVLAGVGAFMFMGKKETQPALMTGAPAVVKQQPAAPAPAPVTPTPITPAPQTPAPAAQPQKLAPVSPAKPAVTPSMAQQKSAVEPQKPAPSKAAPAKAVAKAEPETTAPKTVKTSKTYYVQFGAFKSEDNAAKTIKDLKAKGINTIVIKKKGLNYVLLDKEFGKKRDAQTEANAINKRDGVGTAVFAE